MNICSNNARQAILERGNVGLWWGVKAKLIYFIFEKVNYLKRATRKIWYELERWNGNEKIPKYWPMLNMASLRCFQASKLVKMSLYVGIKPILTFSWCMHIIPQNYRCQWSKLGACFFFHCSLKLLLPRLSSICTFLPKKWDLWSNYCCRLVAKPFSFLKWLIFLLIIISIKNKAINVDIILSRFSLNLLKTGH